jgi:hypothetical protein
LADGLIFCGLAVWQVVGQRFSPTEEEWGDVMAGITARLQAAAGEGPAAAVDLDLDGYLDKFAEEFQEHGQEV